MTLSVSNIIHVTYRLLQMSVRSKVNSHQTVTKQPELLSVLWKHIIQRPWDLNEKPQQSIIWTVSVQMWQRFSGCIWETVCSTWSTSLMYKLLVSLSLMLFSICHIRILYLSTNPCYILSKPKRCGRNFLGWWHMGLRWIIKFWRCIPSGKSSDIRGAKLVSPCISCCSTFKDMKFGRLYQLHPQEFTDKTHRYKCIHDKHHIISSIAVFQSFVHQLISLRMDLHELRSLVRDANCIKQEFVRPRWPYDMRPLHVCHCNSLGGVTWRSVTIDNGTDGQTDRRTDRRTDRVRRNMWPLLGRRAA